MDPTTFWQFNHGDIIVYIITFSKKHKEPIERKITPRPRCPRSALPGFCMGSCCRSGLSPAGNKNALPLRVYALLVHFRCIALLPDAWPLLPRVYHLPPDRSGAVTPEAGRKPQTCNRFFLLTACFCFTRVRRNPSRFRVTPYIDTYSILIQN